MLQEIASVEMRDGVKDESHSVHIPVSKTYMTASSDSGGYEGASDDYRFGRSLRH